MAAKFTVLRLPKGFADFQYYPARPTLYSIRRRGKATFVEERCTLQEPLALKLGDEVLYDSIKSIPEVFLKLTKADSNNEAYAVITTQGPAPQEVRANPNTIFVGNS